MVLWRRGEGPAEGGESKRRIPVNKEICLNLDSKTLALKRAVRPQQAVKGTEEKAASKAELWHGVDFCRLPGQVLKMQTKLKCYLQNDSSAAYG